MIIKGLAEEMGGHMCPREAPLVYEMVTKRGN